MKQITSKLNKKVQFVNDEEWAEIKKRGWANRFTVVVIPERKLSKIELLTPEIKKTTKAKKQ